ncbi:MAG: hypothetical protein WAM94_17395, partial [Chromatiaceae bacterium]
PPQIAPEPPACAALRGMDPDGLSPRAALDAIYQLKAMLDDRAPVEDHKRRREPTRSARRSP